MRYNREIWPEPWQVPTNIKFIKERWDDYPRGGFIEDVILYQKGYETTNFLSFWAAVHYISSTVMRDAWLVWAHGGMYPNFYILMVAPPGTVKKTTTLQGLETAERLSKDEYKNPVLKFKKAGVVIRGKATSEAIFASLANEKLSVELGEDSEGEVQMETIEKNANLIIRVSELSTLLNGAKYNVPLVDKLTDLYDCKDTDSDTTIGRGNVELKNVFCTMIGATTPDTFASTIPKEAFGGGFVSRSIILKEDYTERIFPEPVAWPGLPGTQEIAERLAWIGQYRKGAFTLSPEAYDVYATWYTNAKLALRESIMSGETIHENNRKDIHVLKLALILSLSRYDITNVISLDDINMAMRIIEYTIEKSHDVIKETSLTPENRNLDYLEKFLKRRGIMKRKNLISAVNHRGIDSTMLTFLLGELQQAQKLKVNGSLTGTISKNTEQEYQWVG